MTDALTHTDADSLEFHTAEIISYKRTTALHGAHREMRQVRQVRQELADLARAVSRLSPCHRDPERFHMDKAEIVGELRRLADLVVARP